MKLEDFLKQTASNIISILTLLPSTKIPILSAGDPFRNAMVTLATQLNRKEPILIQVPKDTTSSPRLETPILYNNPPHPAAAPRVDKASRSTNTPATTLQIHSKELKIPVSTIVMSTDIHYEPKLEIQSITLILSHTKWAQTSKRLHHDYS